MTVKRMAMKVATEVEGGGGGWRDDCSGGGGGMVGKPSDGYINPKL